jgi:hypothetical protein
MKKKALLLGLVLLVVAGIGTFVFYPRHQPQFCWLVFGSDAKVRVLVCLDGTAVSLERHGNGSAAQRIAHFDRLEDCKEVVIHSADGESSYVLTGITDLNAVPLTKLLEFTVQVKTPTSEYRQAGWVWMALDLGKATSAPFHGPLSVSPVDKRIEIPNIRWELPAGLTLRRGDKPSDLFVSIGTTNEQNSCRVAVCTVDVQTKVSLFPNDVHPFADIEFPAKDSRDPPIHKRYALAAVC